MFGEMSWGLASNMGKPMSEEEWAAELAAREAAEVARAAVKAAKEALTPHALAAVAAEVEAAKKVRQNIYRWMAVEAEVAGRLAAVIRQGEEVMGRQFFRTPEFRALSAFREKEWPYGQPAAKEHKGWIIGTAGQEALRAYLALLG